MRGLELKSILFGIGIGMILTAFMSIAYFSFQGAANPFGQTIVTKQITTQP